MALDFGKGDDGAEDVVDAVDKSEADTDLEHDVGVDVIIHGGVVQLALVGFHHGGYVRPGALAPEPAASVVEGGLAEDNAQLEDG